MPDPLVPARNLIAPGEYSLAGTDQVLVIEGPAYLKAPTAPTPLIVPAATPAAASTGVPNWLKWVASVASLIAAGAYAGPAVADRLLPPAPAPLVDPVTPQARTQSHSPHSPNYQPPRAFVPALPSPQFPG